MNFSAAARPETAQLDGAARAVAWATRTSCHVGKPARRAVRAWTQGCPPNASMAPRVLRVLNVAEKPSVAREVTRILNNGQQAQQRVVHGCALAWCFQLGLPGRCRPPPDTPPVSTGPTSTRCTASRSPCKASRATCTSPASPVRPAFPTSAQTHSPHAQSLPQPFFSRCGPSHHYLHLHLHLLLQNRPPVDSRLCSSFQKVAQLSRGRPHHQSHTLRLRAGQQRLPPGHAPGGSPRR